MPPSSSEQLTSRRAARSATTRPVAVDPVKQRWSQLSTSAVPTTVPSRDDLPEVVRQARLREQLCAAQSGERGLLVGLEHHGVACGEGGDAVAHGQHERVVPRGDHAHHTLGRLGHLDAGEEREGPERAAGREQPCRAPGVVAGGERDVRDLIVGLLAGLAGLPLDQVHQVRGAREGQVVQPQQISCRAAAGASGPGRLCPPAALDRGHHVVRRARRHVGQALPGEGCRRSVHRGPRRPTHPRVRHQPSGDAAGSSAYEADGSRAGSAGPSDSGEADIGRAYCRYGRRRHRASDRRPPQPGQKWCERTIAGWPG